MRGAAVLWGMGHESAGAPSYWPWMQVGRSYGQAYDLPELVPDMDGKGPEPYKSRRQPAIPKRHSSASSMHSPPSSGRWRRRCRS
jgi:hypothetical protein